MDSEILIKKTQEEFKRTADFLNGELKGLRTNRITTGLVKNLKIEVYGVRTPIEQLASLSIREPRTIVVEPWDKNILKNIEKTIAESNLSISPQAKENKIYLTFPALSEESRNQLVKVLKGKLEASRNSLRTVRDKIRSEIASSEKEKEITEDEKYRLFETLDKLTSAKEAEILSIGERKKREIITI